jgi:hypothetical protein
MDKKFSDGSTSGYAELPVPAAWLKWTRGNAQLSAIKDADPGAYFGGWRAFVLDKEKKQNPVLPLPIIERTSEDGKNKYQVYATNILRIVPIVHRTRFEMRQKVTDPETGREYEKCVQASQKKIPGFVPNRQVFGIVYGQKAQGYAVLSINKWSSFISFEKAGTVWNKITVPDGKLLLRRYGSIGTKDGTPEFEEFGKSRSTPIKAIQVDKISTIDITPELDALYESCLPWANCPMWNAEGEVTETVDQTTKQAFLDATKELKLSNIDIEQLLAENGNDYSKALLALNGDPEVPEGEMPY